MKPILPTSDFSGKSAPQMTEGWHVAQCTDVAELPPSNKYSNAKPRLFFRFQQYDPADNVIRQEQAGFVCSASVFLGNTRMPPSALVLFARQVGYKNIERGINPAAWKGRFFAVYVASDGQYSWVRKHSPCGEPEGADGLDREAWRDLAIQSSPHYGADDVINNAMDSSDPPF